MENLVHPDLSPDNSGATEHARRQFAALEQGLGWLAGALQMEVASPPPVTAPLSDRLDHIVRELSWAGGHDRLTALAERYKMLRDERDLLFASNADPEPEALNAAAFRFEQAASQALALYVDAQAQAAARLAELDDALPDEADEAGRQRHLAEIGETVRAKLDAHPRAELLPAFGLEIYVVRDFLDAEECAGLVALIDQDLVPSGVLGEEAGQDFRTSKSCNLSREAPLVEMVDARLSSLLGLNRRFSEMVQGQRYEVGQQFKPHHDFFHKGKNYYDSVQRQGGQRSWTGMLFLNAVEQGGCTNFPQVGIKVTPETGKLLVWNNMALDGSPNPNSLHQGMPVEAGIKYVITKWFRERPVY